MVLIVMKHVKVAVSWRSNDERILLFLMQIACYYHENLSRKAHICVLYLDLVVIKDFKKELKEMRLDLSLYLPWRCANV